MRDTGGVREQYQLPPLLHAHVGHSPCKGRVSEWAVPGVREMGSHCTCVQSVVRRGGQGEEKRGLFQFKGSCNDCLVQLPDHIQG